MSITVYTTPTCPWCKKTKEFLKEKGAKFREKNVVKDAAARDEMIEKSGQTGVPVIDIDGHLIVGFDPSGIEELLSKMAPKEKGKKKKSKK